MADNINPDHYKRLPAEAIEIIESAIQNAPDNIAAYNHGQQLKYDLRLFEKGKTLREYLIDQEKHCWYSDRLREHLRKLVEQENKCEQQKAADQQSLKDHPFGKLKDPAINQSLITQPPDGWRPNDNVALAMQMAATNSFGGKDGVFNAANFSNAIRQLAGVGCTLDGHVVATILGGRSDVEVLNGGSHYRYLFYESINSLQEPVEPPKPTAEVTGEVTGEVTAEVTAEVTGEVKPPDGWRWLEVGEVIRKGDQGFEKGLFHAIEPIKLGMTLQAHWMPTIRRNRFEVGEKVVRVVNGVVYKVIRVLSMGYQLESEFCAEVILHGKDLAPYIEDAK